MNNLTNDDLSLIAEYIDSLDLIENGKEYKVLVQLQSLPEDVMNNALFTLARGLAS